MQEAARSYFGVHSKVSKALEVSAGNGGEVLLRREVLVGDGDKGLRTKYPPPQHPPPTPNPRDESFPLNIQVPMSTAALLTGCTQLTLLAGQLRRELV